MEECSLPSASFLSLAITHSLSGSDDYYEFVSHLNPVIETELGFRKGASNYIFVSWCKHRLIWSYSILIRILLQYIYGRLHSILDCLFADNFSNVSHGSTNRIPTQSEPDQVKHIFIIVGLLLIKVLTTGLIHNIRSENLVRLGRLLYFSQHIRQNFNVYFWGLFYLLLEFQAKLRRVIRITK